MELGVVALALSPCQLPFLVSVNQPQIRGRGLIPDHQEHLRPLVLGGAGGSVFQAFSALQGLTLCAVLFCVSVCVCEYVCECL